MPLAIATTAVIGVSCCIGRVIAASLLTWQLNVLADRPQFHLRHERCWRVGVYRHRLRGCYMLDLWIPLTLLVG